MMRRNIYLFLMIAVTFVLQSTFHFLIPALTTTPNLLIILIASLGFMRGKKSGLAIGFISGLMVDLIYGNIFGMTALLYMYIGFFNGFLYKVFFDNDIRIPVLAAGISDLCYNLIFFVVEFALNGRLQFGSYLGSVILPEVVSTMIFTIPFYGIFYWLNKKITAVELEEEQSPWLRR